MIMETLPIMHLIYPGMARSVPVFVGDPVTGEDYAGYVWTITVENADDPYAEPVKTHRSRLSDTPTGQPSGS